MANRDPIDLSGLTDYRADREGRRTEWHRYYSAKRIGQQWFQVHLLKDLPVNRVLEVGPHLGLVTAMLTNAGYQVATLDVLPPQFRHSGVRHLQAELTRVAPQRLAGFDAILCCETLEHLHWDAVDRVLATFRAAAPRYLVISVPYMGFQIDWRLYLNRHSLRHSFMMKKLRFLKTFRFDDKADPWGHKWEVGYRGHGLPDLERKLGATGWRILKRDFTSPARSVFYLLERS